MKLPKEVLEAIRQRAEADDRTVSQFLRRLVLASLEEKPEPASK